MEQLKDILVKTTPIATPTGKAGLVSFPSSEAEDLLECERCSEKYPISSWERWVKEDHRQHRVCRPCKRREQAELILSARRDIGGILMRAGFERALASKTIQDVRAGDSFTPERRREVLSLSCSILNPKKRTKRGICFIGPVGRGKTLMATLLARRFVRKGYNEHWLAMCRVPRLISRARDQYSRGFDEREAVEDMLGAYTEKRFLVIDDFGVRRGEATPFEQELLYRLIDERYLTRDRDFTVITTNRTLAEIDRDIDERVRSRIMGMCHVIHLDGPDWRAEGDV